MHLKSYPKASSYVLYKVRSLSDTQGSRRNTVLNIQSPCRKVSSDDKNITACQITVHLTILLKTIRQYSSALKDWIPACFDVCFATLVTTSTYPTPLQMSK